MADEALPVIARFEVHRRSYLAPDGSVLRPLPAFAADLPTLLTLYCGTLLWRGTKMEEILLFWGGDERGNLSSGPAHDFPYCIPVGSQAPQAAGVAYAFKLRKEPRAAVCLFGDGATSKG